MSFRGRVWFPSPPGGPPFAAMKSPTLFLLSVVALAMDGHAAPRKSPGRTATYPGIIQMHPPAGSAPAEGGGIISSEISGLDLRFLRNATQAGVLLSYLGELAKARSQTDHVRKLGATLATAQLEESAALGKLAARKGVTVPTDPVAIRLPEMESLEALEGLKFDKAALEQILAVNRLAVSAYEAGVSSQDSEIKSFVSQMLPVAKARLQLTSKMAGAPAESAGVPRFRTSAPPLPR